MVFFDPLFILFSVPAFLVSAVASLLLNWWTRKYSKVENQQRLTGMQTSERLIGHYGFQVGVTPIRGHLTDNFNPTNQTVSLSEKVAGIPSVTAVAIAAHEFGHVEQYAHGSLLLKARAALVPAVDIGSNLGFILITIGLALSATGLAWAGVALFSLTVLFSLLTLPVEIDASRRAFRMIRELNLLAPTEMPGAKRVLTAAALTYLAALLSALGNLAYFLVQVGALSNNRD